MTGEVDNCLYDQVTCPSRLPTHNDSHANQLRLDRLCGQSPFATTCLVEAVDRPLVFHREPLAIGVDRELNSGAPELPLDVHRGAPVLQQEARGMPLRTLLSSRGVPAVVTKTHGGRFGVCERGVFPTVWSGWV